MVADDSDSQRRIQRTAMEQDRECGVLEPTGQVAEIRVVPEKVTDRTVFLRLIGEEAQNAGCESLSEIESASLEPYTFDGASGLQLGRCANALVAECLFRVAGASPSERLRLLSELTVKLYALHAKSRIKLLRKGHLEDAAAFDGEHWFRCEAAVWQLLERAPLGLAEKEAVGLALAACQSYWLAKAQDCVSSSAEIDTPEKKSRIMLNDFGNNDHERPLDGANRSNEETDSPATHRALSTAAPGETIASGSPPSVKDNISRDAQLEPKPIPDPLQRVRKITAEENSQVPKKISGGTGDVAREANTKCQTGGMNRNAQNRSAQVDAFLSRCNEESLHGFNVIRKHIWKAAGHEWARQFEYWQAGSDKATAEDDRNFRRILALSPPDFFALLVKKGIEPQ